MTKEYRSLLYEADKRRKKVIMNTQKESNLIVEYVSVFLLIVLIASLLIALI